ncbi:MAG TPA: hypothetical protein VLI39_09515 [Sedimentisphaerales bacterium]|nr:hypothetical protein [Sedimentisphaerales bacterium]
MRASWTGHTRDARLRRGEGVPPLLFVCGACQRLRRRGQDGLATQGRDALATWFHYDLDAICEDLRKREKASGQPTVSLPPKRIGKKKPV